jgi:hypothetical protein
MGMIARLWPFVTKKRHAAEVAKLEGINRRCMEAMQMAIARKVQADEAKQLYAYRASVAERKAAFDAMAYATGR